MRLLGLLIRLIFFAAAVSMIVVAVLMVYPLLRPATRAITTTSAQTTDLFRDAAAGLAQLTALAETKSDTNTDGRRIWTSVDGRKVEARIIGATNTSATIQRTSDGRSFTVNLTAVSQNDREYVKRWLARPEQ